MYTSTKSISKIIFLTALVILGSSTSNIATVQITLREESLKKIARATLKLATGISGLILMTKSTLQLKKQLARSHKKQIPLKRSLAYYCLGMGIGIPLFIGAIIALKSKNTNNIPQSQTWAKYITNYIPELSITI